MSLNQSDIIAETIPMIVATGNEEAEASAGDNAETSDDVVSGNGTEQLSFWRYLWSYQSVELLLCFATVLIGLSLQLVEPYQRPIPYQSLNDGTILRNMMYDNVDKGETVGPTVLLVVAIPVPILVQIALCILLTRNASLSERREMIHRTLCVYFLGIGLTYIITNVGKRYTGYLRPIFYDLCEPSYDYTECLSESNYYAGASSEWEARVSFPSGHASFSVCSCLLFSLFLEHFFGKTAYMKTVAKPNGSETQQQPLPPTTPWIRIISVLCYTPVLLGIFIALSRVHDNHHHPADIVGGTLLGGTVASFVFDIWFS